MPSAYPESKISLPHLLSSLFGPLQSPLNSSPFSFLIFYVLLSATIFNICELNSLTLLLNNFPWLTSIFGIKHTFFAVTKTSNWPPLSITFLSHLSFNNMDTEILARQWLHFLVFFMD